MNASQSSMEEIQGVPNWILNEYQRRQNKPHYHHEDLMISDNMFRGDRQISSTGSYGWNASSSTSTIPSRFHQEERKPSIYSMHNSMYTNSIGVVPDSHLTTSSMYEGIHFPQQTNYPTMNFMNNNGEDTRATCMGANFLGFSPSLVKNEGFLSQDVDRIGLDLGARTYFSTEDDVNYDSYCNINSMAMSRLYKRRAMSNVSQVPRCQAEGCKADLSTAKHYHRRHKVCELHSKAATVISAGLTQRFCQQCSRFHVLSEFDEGKRSCRKRLADHNRRRRKPQNNQQNVTLVPDTSTTSGSNANDNSKEQEDNYVINNKQSHSDILQGMKNNQVDISLSESGSLTRMSLSPHRNAKTTNENMEGSYDETLGVGIPWLRATNGENNNNSNHHGLARNCNNVYDFNEVCSTSSSRGYSSFTDLDWTSNAKMMFKTLEEQEMVATLKEWKIRRGSLQ